MTQAVRSIDEVAFVPGRVQHIYAMRRRGTHALTHCIMQNMKSGGLLLNNRKPARTPDFIPRLAEVTLT